MSEVKIQRVIIVHGWADDPTKGWISWLVRELEARGVEASAPQMPTPKEPKVNEWVAYLNTLVGQIDHQTVLVGHSLGVYVLLRYLDQYRPTHGEKLGKLVLVAGFAGHERATQGKRALPEVGFKHIASKVEQIYSIYSDNDASISPDWSKQLGTDLGGTNILDPGKGHFAGYHGCETLDSVLGLI